MLPAPFSPICIERGARRAVEHMEEEEEGEEGGGWRSNLLERDQSSSFLPYYLSLPAGDFGK